jgi:predicted ATPase/DNA-binding XRE family transcriptional regulator
MDQAHTFGVLLRRHRVAAGLTQEQLAEAAGLSERAITDLERGVRRFPYPDTIARLADALRLDDILRADFQRAGRRISAVSIERDAPTDDDHVLRDGRRAAGEMPPNNLPAQVTSFVGRESELTELKRLLRATRLLTLTGSGGSGKTRLALQAASDLLGDYPQGVWVVDLAPLTHPELVPHAVAALLGARQEPGRELYETLASTLRQSHLLLMLDNCEHLVTACAQLVDALIHSCPQLNILATSREALGVAGETTWRVPPLRAADPRHLPELDALTQYEAVRLFVDRAVAVQPGFGVTNQNAPAVAQICYRLDGIPLAIELAAARARVLTPEQISERLDNRFHLLTGGHRMSLPRQRTLRALVDWSHDLLSAEEKVLFRRLSVFRGGWTLDAAEAVCAGESLETWQILDLLSSLVDKSLVLADEQPDGRMRYRMLETLREYGHDQLRHAAEEVILRDRHRDWFTGLAETAEPELWKAEQETWLQRLEVEHDNLRAALDWSAARGAHTLTEVEHFSGTASSSLEPIQTHATEAGLRLAAALGRFWCLRGYLAEGRARLETHLELAPSATPVRSRALSAAAVLALFQGDYTRLREFATEALAISELVKDRFGRAMALLVGEVSAHVVDRDEARAKVLAEDCLRLWTELGNDVAYAYAEYTLAEITWTEGDHSQAVTLMHDALARALKGDDRFIAGVFRARLAHLMLLRGDVQEALALEQENLRDRWARGDRWGIAESLTAIAWAEVRIGAPERATMLLAAGEILWSSAGGALLHQYADEHKHARQAAIDALGPEVFAEAWAEGQRLPLEEVVAQALALVQPHTG